MHFIKVLFFKGLENGSGIFLFFSHQIHNERPEHHLQRGAQQVGRLVVSFFTLIFHLPNDVII